MKQTWERRDRDEISAKCPGKYLLKKREKSGGESEGFLRRDGPENVA
jgi:hypothetical protein